MQACPERGEVLWGGQVRDTTSTITIDQCHLIGMRAHPLSGNADHLAASGV